MSRTKEKSSFVGKFFTVIVVLIVIVALLYFFAWGTVKGKVVDTVAEKAITNVAEQAGVDAEAATQLYNSMSEEDQETVQTMVENHADAQTVESAISMYKNGDKEGLKELAYSELSDEEINELVGLYQKYLN
ncbi:MAG: hypothetical protein K5675_01395 [Lachnospiraceae bacterium]|nr:hypothetical protein [Lachnospiraceae bacterium]